MTVAQLKKALEAWPDDMVVYIDWDPEGGNELTPTDLVEFKEAWLNADGVKIT